MLWSLFSVGLALSTLQLTQELGRWEPPKKGPPGKPEVLFLAEDGRAYDGERFSLSDPWLVLQGAGGGECRTRQGLRVRRRGMLRSFEAEVMRMKLEYVGSVLFRVVSRTKHFIPGSERTTQYSSYGLVLPKKAVVQLGWKPQQRLDVWVDGERGILVARAAREPAPPEL